MFGGEPDTTEGGPRFFYLVESREGPPDGQHFRKQLQANGTFDTDFIGATPEDCQKWLANRLRYDRAPYDSLLTIVDARSAEEGTLLIQHYVEPPAGTEQLVFGGYGVLPKETNVWYDFRVDYRQAGKVMASLTETTPEIIFPIYFGNKEIFTNEDGVFDVEEATRYCRAKDPDVLESEIYQRKFWPLPEGVQRRD